MRYVPSTATYDKEAPRQDKYTLGEDLIAAVERGVTTYDYHDESPEVEFVQLARNPNIFHDSRKAIEAYVNNINDHLKTENGVLDYMKVAETRRRTFRPPPRSQRPPHPLAEFDLTLPYAQKMDPGFEETWVMKSNGTVASALPVKNVWHPRDNQAHLIASGCPFSQGV